MIVPCESDEAAFVMDYRIRIKRMPITTGNEGAVAIKEELLILVLLRGSIDIMNHDDLVHVI